VSERFALLAALALVLPASATAQDWRTVTYLRQTAGEERLRVEVEYGAGHFQVEPAGPETLYRANLRYDAEVFRPVSSYRSGELRIGVDGGNIRGRNLKSGHLQLRLGPTVPLDLILKFGATEADLELGGLRIHSARISTGASRTNLRVSQANPDVCSFIELEVGAAQFSATGLANLHAERLKLSGGVGEVVLDFTGDWRTDMTADINMGLGALTLRVPRGVGVRVHKEGLFAGFDSQGLVKRGDAYFSEDWEAAERKLNVNLDAALGSIRMAWVDRADVDD
jgi:N-terminal domain of toast_rack, DUF2154